MKALPAPRTRRRPPASSRPSAAAPDGKFMAVPYSVEYQGELARAAALLREAAALTAQPTLKTFLRRAPTPSSPTTTTRATWRGWSSTPASSRPSGPYEVYEDEWFNYKAALRGVHRPCATTPETAEAGHASAPSCRSIEDNLPIDPKLRNPKLGALAPIRVVNSVFSAGDGNRGVQTAAFNLPNDERVDRGEGHQARDAEERPGGEVRARAAADRQGGARPRRTARTSSFDAFFTHILMHELMHGLGPHNITRRRPSDDRAPGAEGDLQRASRRPRRTSPACGRCSTWSTRACSTSRWSGPCTRRSWRRRSARSASASTKRTARAWRCSSTTSSTPARCKVTPDGTFAVDAGEDQAERHDADDATHDAAGQGRLRRRRGADREAGRRAPAGADACSTG